jgi:hypothetical protein
MIHRAGTIEGHSYLEKVLPPQISSNDSHSNSKATEKKTPSFESPDRQIEQPTIRAFLLFQQRRKGN